MLNNHTIYDAESQEVFSTGSTQAALLATKFIRVSRQEMIQLKADCNTDKSLHQRAQLKIKDLKAALHLEKGKVRDLNHRLYGKKTEKAISKPESIPPPDDFVGPPRPPTKRGAKKGRANRPRHQSPDLPVIEERITLTDAQ